MFEIKRKMLTPDHVNFLAEAVGWGRLNTEQLDIAIKNSVYAACVMDNDKVIAAGRMFGDISMAYFIRDVIVHPDYQGKGVGKLLIEDMLSFVKETTPKEWHVCVELISASGKENFYEKLGFERRSSDDGDTGMFLRINNIR